MSRKVSLLLLAVTFLVAGLYSRPVYADDTGNTVLVVITGAPPATCSIIQIFVNKTTGAVYYCPAGLPILSGSPAITPVSQTGQTGTQTTVTLCSTTACPVGQYAINLYLASTVTCATPGPAAVAATFGYTDDVAARTLTPTLVGVGTSTNTITLGNLTSFGMSSVTIWTAGGANITYTLTMTACTTGSTTYSARIAMERLQ